MTEVELGERYRDSISGFTGVATARAVYLHSSPEVMLEATLGPTDEAKTRWIKESRLEPAPQRSDAGFGA